MSKYEFSFCPCTCPCTHHFELYSTNLHLSLSDNGKNGRKSPSPQRGHSEDLKWSKNNGNGNGIGPYPGAAYSPVDSPESRVGVTSDNNRGPGGGSPQRDRELDSWARNDRSRAQDSRDREGGRGRNGDRTRDSSRERRSDSRSEGTGPRRSESARRTPSRPDPSPQYMISTASFASKLKKLRVDSSEVKRKPGMRAGSVSAVLKYSTNQRSQSFSSSYNPNKFKSTGSKSDSAQRDYEEYGDDVMEYSGPLSGGNIENFRISRDNDFSSLRNGTSTSAHTQHTQHAHQTQNIMRSRSTEASRDRKDDRSRVKVAEPAGVKALSSSSTARYGYSGGSASVRQARETSANEPSLGYMNNFLKEHSSRTLHLDTEDRHRRSHHDNGKEAFFSPTLLRRPETTAGVRGGARARAGAGRSPSPSPSPTWCEDSEYRDDGSPGGVYTMPQFKRYHEQLGRARGRS